MIITENDALLTDKIELITGEAMDKNGCSTGQILVFSLSDALDLYFKNRDEQREVELEIRKKGLIVTLLNEETHFYWLIPFVQLSIYQSTFLSIHAQGLRIQVYREQLVLLYPDYVKNLLKEKNRLLAPADYYGY